MITGELKNKIDNLWDIFASGGLVNPLEVIEQITYLMFIHDLDDSDNTRAKESAMLGLPYQSIFSEEVKIGERTIDGSQLKWSVFHDFPADRMYSVIQEWVFPFIKTLHSDKNSAYSKYMDDAIFKLPTPLVLSKVVDSLDEIYKMMNEIQTADVRGDVYEYLLEKIAKSGRNGQFRTPRHIIRMMVEMMDPSSDEVICDPACGTSGFLIAAGEYLKEKKKSVKIVAVEPSDSPVLSKGTAGPHKIQGIGAGFVPTVLNTQIYDEIMPITAEKSFETAKLFAHKEGILVGISSGAALYAAIEQAKREENKGKTIVALLPDSGDRYYSTPLFES